MKNKEGLSWEVSVGVTFSSFMGAITLFFTGILISQYSNFDSTLRVALLFLIISTFSFIFAATIYSNAGIDITAGKLDQVKKYLIYANNIFEFLGLYLLIITIPLIISSVTKDAFLRTVTITVATLGIALYSQSSFSILHKETLGTAKKYLLTIIIVGLTLLLYLTQLTATDSLFSYKLLATLLLIALGSFTILSCRNSKQYSEF